jgi:uncharacterized membrane protein YkoI
MRAWYLVFGLILICGLGCATLDEMFEHEKEVPLSDVPAVALKAAQGAVDGINITEAEMEKEDGQTVYVFEGDANGRKYEIEVTPEGKINEIEEKGKDNSKDDDN